MKKAILLFLLIISTYSIYAQTENYKSGSLLWKISGKDLSKPSYLLGTFHLKSGEFLDSIPGAKAALDACEQVVGEVNMSDMAAMMIQMQQAMVMTSDTTYKMLYSDEEYQLVSEKLASLTGGTGLDQMGMLKPAAIQLTVISFAYMKYFPDAKLTNILDVWIQSEATKAQKPVLGLETVNDQIHALFGIMDLQRQADALLCSMKHLDESMGVIPELINDYDRADLNKLVMLMENSEYCPSLPAETDALNKDRNNVWVKKLPEIMKEKSSFIAVGALHLAGKDGLLNLLEKAGYNIEPVGL